MGGLNANYENNENNDGVNEYGINDYIKDLNKKQRGEFSNKSNNQEDTSVISDENNCEDVLQKDDFIIKKLRKSSTTSIQRITLSLNPKFIMTKKERLLKKTSKIKSRIKIIAKDKKSSNKMRARKYNAAALYRNNNGKAEKEFMRSRSLPKGKISKKRRRLNLGNSDKNLGKELIKKKYVLLV